MRFPRIRYQAAIGLQKCVDLYDRAVSRLCVFMLAHCPRVAGWMLLRALTFLPWFRLNVVFRCQSWLLQKIILPAMIGCFITGYSQAAVRTENFIVRAAPEYEQPLASAAERFRRELAIDWLGYELPAWSEPCPISATIEPGLGNGGTTEFTFDQGQVFDFSMSVQGDPHEIVQVALKHEVLHTVFATHFLQPLPRWADEGACCTIEGRKENLNSHRRLVRFLQTGRGIAFDQLFEMIKYPDDILPLYDQGRSLAFFLLEHGGKRHYVDFLSAGLKDQDWQGAVASHYGYDSLGELQACWLDWVKTGSRLVPGEVRLRAPDT